MDVLQSETEEYLYGLITHYNQLKTELKKYNDAITYYNESGKILSAELISTSGKAFQNGEVDFMQYILSIDNAKTIEMTYLDNLNQYNQTVLELNYLMN